MLAYLLTAITREVITQMVVVETAHAAWTALTTMFSSHSRSRIKNLRISLSNAEKGTQTVGAYFAYMRGLADELAAAGKPLDDDEQISYIIAGMGMEYQPLVSALDARTDLSRSMICSLR